MHDNSIRAAWRQANTQPYFKWLFIGSLALLVTALSFYSHYLDFNETREGIRYSDPLIAWFTPVDVSWITFVLIYSGLIFGIIVLLRYPNNLLLAIQTYALMVLVRMLAMYSLPLAPPETTIPLIDPVVQLFGEGHVLMKDLFFSGHTSTIFMLFLTAPNRTMKRIFFLATILIVVSVLVQHTHYSVDVIAAPFFVYGCYGLACYFDRRVMRLTLRTGISKR
jgi:hypothetical protein